MIHFRWCLSGSYLFHLRVFRIFLQKICYRNLIELKGNFTSIFTSTNLKLLTHFERFLLDFFELLEDFIYNDSIKKTIKRATSLIDLHFLVQIVFSWCLWILRIFSIILRNVHWILKRYLRVFFNNILGFPDTPVLFGTIKDSIFGILKNCSNLSREWRVLRWRNFFFLVASEVPRDFFFEKMFFKNLKKLEMY